nr:MAG TPA: hypothetical protein [Caudoviricetes sp.]
MSSSCVVVRFSLPAAFLTVTYVTSSIRNESILKTEKYFLFYPRDFSAYSNK